jgi:WD repeat and SOF domain-containing protein 1
MSDFRWKPFDPSRNWPDLGPRFIEAELAARRALRSGVTTREGQTGSEDDQEDRVEDDRRDLDWATVMKRTFEAYVRGERPNMYGEMLRW